MRKFYFKCNESAHICDKHQYKEAGFLDRMKMKIHLILCTLCRNYAKRNGNLTEKIKLANIKSLNANEKELLKHRLTQEMNNKSNS